jgi:hypothetical protein
MDTNRIEKFEDLIAWQKARQLTKVWKSEFDYTGIVKCDGEFFLVTEHAMIFPFML